MSAGELRTQSGQAFNVNDALGDALAPGAVRQFGEYLLFFSPYLEVLEPGDGGFFGRMYTLEEVSQGKGHPDLNALSAWPLRFLDAVNLAMAQQAILAGVYSAPVVAQMLYEKGFGQAVSVATGVKCTDAVSEYAANPYISAMCIFDEPDFYAFRANVVHAVVLQALKRSNSTLAEYQFALERPDPSHLSKIAPGLHLVRNDGDDKKLWAFQIKNRVGNWVTQEFPSAVQIRADIVAYSVAESGLRDLRERLLERHVLQTEGLKMAGAKQFYIRQAALNDPSLVASPFIGESAAKVGVSLK